MSIDLIDQVACVQREIAMRERVYPRWVEKGKMLQTKADKELRTMRAVLETLNQMVKTQRPGLF